MDKIFDAHIYSLLKFTLLQASLSTILSILVGLMLAWSLNHQPSFRGRSVLVTLFSSSLVLPSLIVAFGIISVLGNNGWLNHFADFVGVGSFGSYVYGLSGILIAHTYLNGSYASIGLLRAFESIPIDKYKLSKSLGFNPWQRFKYIEWVAIKSTIPSIAVTIFLLCFSSFAIVLLLGGSPAYNTLEVAIYEAVRIDFDIPYALKIASIQLVISTALLLLSLRFRGAPSNLKRPSSLIPWRDPVAYRYIQTAVITLLAFIYILPIVSIIIDGIKSDLLSIIARPLFIRSFIMSISIATISAVLAILISYIAGDTKRYLASPYGYKKGLGSKVLEITISLLTNIYLAIPTMIMGLGFFLMSQSIGGDIFIWSITAIVTANILMSLPFVSSVLHPSMQKTMKRYGKLAISLDLSYFQRLRYIEWPYLKRSILYSFALSFALSLGDLGVIALFGNKDITTLPWYLYQLMGSYRTNDANGVAFLLLVLIMAVFGIVSITKRSKGKYA